MPILTHEEQIRAKALECAAIAFQNRFLRSDSIIDIAKKFAEYLKSLEDVE